MKQDISVVRLASAGLVIGALLLSACGQAATTPTAAPTTKPASVAPTTAPPTSSAVAPSTVATAAPASAPATPAAAPSGELRVGLSNFGGGSFDPLQAGGPAARAVISTVYDSLVGVSLNGVPGPGLAERWDVTPDGKTWTFNIRKGVKFHDGSDLTGADVKFSLERVLAPTAASSYAASLRATVDKVDLKDDYTIVISLKKPDVELWKWLSLFGASEGTIVSKKYVEAQGNAAFLKPIGTGPWKMLKNDTNVQVELEAVEGHWRAKPQFKRLVLKNITEEATRAAMLKTGDLDVIQISPEKVSELKSGGFGIVGVEAAVGAGLATYPDLDNLAAKPIGDLRVRKALSLALNRQEISDKLFAGFARPAALAGFFSTSPYFDPNVLKPDPYDPTQAKALLAQAGLANGFTIKIFPAMTTSWMPMLAEAIAGYWDKIGVKASIDTRDYAAMRALVSPVIHNDLKGNAIMWQMTPYPYFGMRPTHYASAYHKNHKNTELDSLIDKTEATLDMAERKKLGSQAGLTAQQEYSLTGIVEAADLFAVGKTVGQWNPIKGFSIPALEYERIPKATR